MNLATTQTDVGLDFLISLTDWSASAFTSMSIPGSSVATVTVAGSNVIIAYGFVKVQADRNVLNALKDWNSKRSILDALNTFTDSETWMKLAANGYIVQGDNERSAIFALMYLRALELGVDAEILNRWFGGNPLSG